MGWWAWLVGSVADLPPLTDARAYWSMDLAHPYRGELGGPLAWHAFRGEWRSVGVAVTVTATLVVTSAISVPHLWIEWVGVLASSDRAASNIYVLFAGWPLVVRLAMAVALVANAARLERPALLPVACLVALPAVWINALAMLVACWPLVPPSGTRKTAPSLN